MVWIMRFEWLGRMARSRSALLGGARSPLTDRQRLWVLGPQGSRSLLPKAFLSREHSLGNRVFVDVGARAGGTAQAVFNSPYTFDRVISVEPDPEMIAKLQGKFASRLSEDSFAVAPYAISTSRGQMTLYGSNTGGGASLVAGKVSKKERADGVSVNTISWGDFLDLYDLHGSELYVKMNCEGGEIDIVKSMIEHDRGQIRSMVIDFDIIKSAGGGWKKWASVSALRRAGIPFLLSEKIFVKGAARPRIENWLGGLREFAHPIIERTPVNVQQVVRIKYIEVISACGMKHDFLKRR